MMVYVRYINEYDYPKFSPNDVYTNEKHPSKKDRPYLLEHIFDLTNGEYVVNSNQCCYYNPVDTSNFHITCKNDGIVTVNDDGFIVAENSGSTSILIEDKDYFPETVNDNVESKFNLKIIVSNKNVKPNKLKDTLFLLKDTMIHIDTVLHHIQCPHYFDCIWERKIWDVYDNPNLKQVVDTIKNNQELINAYNTIIEDYRNNIITYHDGLEQYYDIKINDGNVDVSVPNNFSSLVKKEINLLRLELRDLNRKRNLLEMKK